MVSVLLNSLLVFALAVAVLTTVEVILDRSVTGPAGSRTTLGELLHGPDLSTRPTSRN